MNPDFRDPNATRFLITAVEEHARRTMDYAKRHRLGRGAEEAILNDEIAYRKRIAEGIPDYNGATPTDLAAINRPDHDGVFVRVRGSIVDMAKARQYEVIPEEASLIEQVGSRSSDDEIIRSLVTKLWIVSPKGEEIETELFYDRILIETLQVDRNHYALFDILLFVTTGVDPAAMKDLMHSSGASRTPPRRYNYFLVHARALKQATQIVGATPGEQEVAWREWHGRDDILQAASQVVCEHLGLVAEDHTLQREAIHFTVLSQGMRANRGGMVLIGPPASGKSIPHKVAACIAPAFTRIDASKFTEAGLVGDARSGPKHRRPGLIPQAHTGTFSIEDCHQMNGVKNGHAVAILSQVMQEGRIQDGSASRISYEANVSVIIDSNRKSDVRRQATDAGGLDRLVQDTGIPTNILTRATYIAEWPRDHLQAIRMAQEIITGRDQTTESRRVSAYRVRILQVYLAMARDRFPEVSIPPDFRATISKVFLEAFNAALGVQQREPAYMDFLTRGATQALEMVAAHARLAGRDYATSVDLDAVYPFIWRKIDTIRNIIQSGTIGSEDVSATTSGRKRMIDIYVRNKRLTGFASRDLREQLKLHSVALAVIEQELTDLYGPSCDQGLFHVV